MSYYWTNFGIYSPPNDITVTGLDPASTSHTILQDIGLNSHAQIDGHIANSINPHGGTLTQTTINSTNITNTQLIDTFDLTSPTGKITALQCAQINNLSPATGLIVATPIIQNNTNLITNNTPDNVITSSTSGSNNIYTKTPFSSFVTPTSSNVLSNKTIDTAAPNTIQVGSTNITSIISPSNPLLTSSSPTFTRLNINSIGSIGLNITSPAGSQPGLSFDSVGNTYCNFNAASSTKFQVGAFSSISKAILWSSNGYPLSLGTAGVERLLIPSSGIPSSSVSNNILTLNGTQLEYRDASSLPSANPFNQTLNTTDSAIFGGVTINRNTSGGTLTINQTYPNDNHIYFTASGAPGMVIGNDFATSTSYVNGFGRLTLGSQNIERLSIPETGIPIGSSANNLLCLNGTQLETRLISSLPNPFDQTLNTTNSPSFYGLNLTSGSVAPLSMTNGYITRANDVMNVIEASTYPDGLEVRDFSFAGIVPIGGANTDLFIYSILFPYVGCIDLIFTAGTSIGGYGSYHYNYPVVNITGVTTVSGSLYSDKKENVAPFPGKLSINATASGAFFILRFTNSGAVPIKVAGRARIDMCSP